MSTTPKKTERVRLDVYLVEAGLSVSRQKAQAEIMSGNVLLNESPVFKPGLMIERGAPVRLREKFPYVSRGALKLLKALDEFQIPVAGRVAIDIGSSTGGFTQVLLERGAELVYAVDSGTNQLDWLLRNDPRVVVRENTNARYIEPGQFAPPPTLATVDVSFISVTRILPPLTQVLGDGYDIVVLIKPQFELDKTLISSGGYVKKEHRPQAVERVLSCAQELGLCASPVIESPIAGNKSGNIEFLVRFTPQ